MKFKEYLKESENIKDWNGYIKRIPMLKSAIDIMKKMEKYGDIYIVGGAVRDIISGEKEPDDIDFATNIPIEIIEDNFETFDIGKNKEFGIVVVKHQGFDFEIAQMRQDDYNEMGKGATKVKIVKDFKDDAARRDFTVNALAVDVKGNIIDYFEGEKAIRNKIISAVGDPKKRFEEDSVRMLRAVRFSSRLGFSIDDKTTQAIKDMSKDINNVPPERIMKEVLKMAQQEGTKFADAIIQLDNVGLLKEIFPEIVKMKEFKHDAEHHPEGDLWDHTIAALRANKLKDPILNLAVLLHDVGKLNTYELDSKGKHTYHGHAKASMDIIDNISDRLKLDNKTRKALIFSSGKHMHMHDFFKMSNSKLTKLIQDENWDLLYNVGMLDDKARKHLYSQKNWDLILIKVQELTKKYKDKKAQDHLRKIVNGQDVMRIKKMKPSKEVGIIIKNTIEWIQDNNISLQDVKKIHKYIKEL